MKTSEINWLLVATIEPEHYNRKNRHEPRPIYEAVKDMETILQDPDRWERVEGYEFVHDTGIHMLLRETEPTDLFPDIKISSLVLFWMDGKPPFKIRTENSITREFYAKILFREAKACFDRVALLAKLAAE